MKYWTKSMKDPNQKVWKFLTKKYEKRILTRGMKDPKKKVWNIQPKSMKDPTNKYGRS